MSNQLWREQLKESLYRHGLPNEYVLRLVEELSDHATDLFMEEKTMNDHRDFKARLGTPDQLAVVALSEFQRRTFLGRHPMLTFIAGPIVAMIGTFVAICFTISIGCWSIDRALGSSLTLSSNEELGVPLIVHVVDAAVRFVTFVVPTLLFVYLGQRTGQRSWSVGACFVIALVAIFFWTETVPKTAQSPGMWIVGLGCWTGVSQLLQAAIPLALGAWMLMQLRRNIDEPIAAQ